LALALTFLFVAIDIGYQCLRAARLPRASPAVRATRCRGGPPCAGPRRSASAWARRLVCDGHDSAAEER
jgi:hypothetical protein